MCVAILDGMAFLQSLVKLHYTNICEDLSNHFVKHYRHTPYDKMQIAFDRYSIPDSLKSATRLKRLKRSESISHIFQAIQE